MLTTDAIVVETPEDDEEPPGESDRAVARHCTSTSPHSVPPVAVSTTR